MNANVELLSGLLYLDLDLEDVMDLNICIHSVHLEDASLVHLSLIPSLIQVECLLFGFVC